MKQAKILILEDEAIVALDIKVAIEELGFEVTQIATNYNAALESVKQNKPDILLADINLENSINGIETASAIQTISPTPIIYLTAFCDDITISKAAKTDPIGYISKPFKKSDLKSNILLAIHKINNSKKTILPDNCRELGLGFYFNEKDKILYFQDIIIQLSKNEKKLFNILLKANGNIVPFRTIENLIWTEAPASDSTLRTLIYRLRTKLDPKFIDTIKATGCRLNLES